MPDTLNISNLGFQKTLKKEVFCEGIGLHSGKKTKIQILPADVNTGITFIREDLTKNQKIDAFVTALDKTKKGFRILVRWSKGTDIDAGCGQLAIQEK